MGEGVLRSWGTRMTERVMLRPAKKRVLLRPRVWAIRRGSGKDVILWELEGFTLLI